MFARVALRGRGEVFRRYQHQHHFTTSHFSLANHNNKNNNKNNKNVSFVYNTTSTTSTAPTHLGEPQQHWVPVSLPLDNSVGLGFEGLGLTKTRYQSYSNQRFHTRSFATAAASPPPADQPKKEDDKDKDKEISRYITLVDKPLSKVEKSVKALLQKKIEEQDSLNYTLLGSFKDSTENTSLPVRLWRSAKNLAMELPTKKFWVDSWASIKKELHHYKMGFKLLWVDVKIATRLLGQIMHGKVLTRREHEQFVRTASDMMRLVPLIVVIVVPFMEFALPIALKLFPNMLPSMFQDKTAKSHAELKMKLEMARFLQETVEHMAVESKAKKGESESVADLAEFFDRSRRLGHVHTDEILKFAKLFRDELTLDNLQHDTLRALCRLLSLPAMGTSTMLRFRLRMRLHELKTDDLEIMKEGVETLTVVELQQACRDRGMRALGISEEGLRERLREWLSLHLQDDVPPSLLLMSRLLYIPEDIPEVEKIRIAINSLPDTLKDEARVEVVEGEGGAVDYDTRIRITLNEEKLIKQESLEDTEAVLRKAAKQALDTAASAARTTTSGTIQLAVAPVVSMETPHPETLKDTAPLVHDKKEDDDSPITPEELIELAFSVLSMTDLLRTEQQAVSRLKVDVAEHREDVSKLAAVDPKLKVPEVSERLAHKVETMVAQIDKNLQERGQKLGWSRRIDLDGDGYISTNELMRIMKRMRPGVDPKAMERFAQILDTDHDGVLAMNVIKKVLDIVAREGADLKPRDLHTLTVLVEKELEKERDKIAAAAATHPSTQQQQQQQQQFTNTSATRTSSATVTRTTGTAQNVTPSSRDPSDGGAGQLLRPGSTAPPSPHVAPVDQQQPPTRTQADGATTLVDNAASIDGSTGAGSGSGSGSSAGGSVGGATKKTL